MILAEIADKMLPASFYIGAAFLFGGGTAAALTVLKGIWRFIGFGVLALVASFLVWGSQIDVDLIEAARNELGKYYLIISGYWIAGSVAIVITFSLMFRSVGPGISGSAGGSGAADRSR